MIRYLLLFLLGYAVFRLFQPLLQKSPDKADVKGKEGEDDNIQKKYKSRIQDADFEDLD